MEWPTYVRNFLIMKTPLQSSGALVILIAILGSSAVPLPADASDFRFRIPNPLPRISKKMEKVGGFFYRTARRLEGVGDDEDTRRIEPVRLPSNPTAKPQSKSASASLPSNDTQRREMGREYLEETGETRSSLQTKPSPATPPAGTLAESPVPPNDSSTANKSGPSRELDPQSTVKSHELLTQAESPNGAGDLSLVPTTSPPTPEVEAKPRSKSLYGRSVPNRPGLVYPPGREQIPENMVDVRGITPGTKVRDPATGEIFLVP